MCGRRERLLVERRTLYRMRSVGLLAAVVQTTGGAAGIIITYVVFTVGGANPDNGIARFVAGLTGVLAPGFHDLFTPADANLRVVINYGLAAASRLFVTGVVTRGPRRAASPYQIS